MTAGNALFRRRPRLFWQVLALNLLLCALWIPLLSATLDLTYPPLLVIQVPLYLFPLCGASTGAPPPPPCGRSAAPGSTWRSTRSST